MKFTGELNQSQLKKVNQCNSFLNDPARLEALRNTGMMDTPKEEVFDRLANLAAKILKVPLTIVSFVSDEKQFFKAAYGLPSPYDVTRTLPIDASLCRYTMAGDSIISNDASHDPFLKLHPSTGPWGISAIIVLPMITNQGHVLGAFCAIDPNPREWTELDLEVMKELTAAVMSELNLREQISKLKSEQNLRDTFVAALTHDLRTPLTASKLSAQMLARKSDNPEVQTAVTKITNSLSRADKMIQNLLDANQIKAGSKISLNYSNCNIHSIINNLLQDLQIVHNNKFQLEALEDSQIIADENSIQRIIENLVSNAVKYGEPNSSVLISVKKINSNTEICVKNFGDPIPETELAHIFAPFHRTVSAIESLQKGWGLGLPLVKGLAEAHGGSVSVTSSREEGTTFTVMIPNQPSAI